MCDSAVVSFDFCKHGHTVFGKASDRSPNEPQPIVFVPAKDHAPGEMLKCTYIEVEQAAHTYAVILSKPSWIWGAEIGVNEHGVCIGNEAVFSKELNTTETALLGMDILRIALERAATAEEAVDVIAEMMERYGQGGNPRFDNVGDYDNGYLIADEKECWHVETAGRHFWAARKVSGPFSISNYLSLNRPDRMHADLVANAKAKGYEVDEPFDFAKAYIDWSAPSNPSGLMRRCCSYQRANVPGKEFTLKDMIGLLRTHYTANPWTDGKRCVCMHAGDPAIKGGNVSQTCSAMAVECRGRDSVIWATGMGVTCIAPFQPCWFDAYSKKQVFEYDDMEAAVAEWIKREGINRAILAGKICESEYKAELAALETDWHMRVDAVSPDRASRQALCDAIADEAEAFVCKWLKKAETAEEKPIGPEEFRIWWKQKNAALGKDSRIAR